MARAQRGYQGFLGNTSIGPVPDWYQRHIRSSRQQWLDRHAETLAALAVPESRRALEESCRKTTRSLRSLPKRDPEAIAATLGDDDVTFMRLDVQEMMDWLRTLDADLATRHIHIERARGQESEASS